MSAVSLADVKVYLHITVSTYDSALPGFIDAAESLIAQRVGPLTATVRTDRVTGNCDVLVLPVSPVLSLTSVTPVNGTAITLSDLHLNPASGVVTWNYGQRFAWSSYDVTYTAGRTSLPPDLVLAVKELVRHLWTSQRGPSGSPSAGDSMEPAPPTYLVPYRVAELLNPYLQPGFA